MKTWLSIGDLIDLNHKYKQKKNGLLGRFFKGRKSRVSSYWDEMALPPSNWWNVPGIRARWREKISGDKTIDYPEYLRKKYLEGKSGLKMLSPGCGTGSHELLFTNFKEIDHIDALDISEKSIEVARKNAPENISYFVADFHQWLAQPGENYDIILFHSSLHHFSNLHTLLPLIGKRLNPEGLLVIHEYTGPDRMMWTREQLTESDRLLHTLPLELRTIWGTNKIKKKHYRPGLLRTLMTDPSESIESGRIIPLLHKHYTTIEERPLGGNLLHLILKDIAHHFTGNSEMAAKELERLAKEEDRFISSRSSDFIFGVYRYKG